MNRQPRGILARAGVIALGAVCCLLMGFTWPWESGGPWPKGSKLPLTPLVRPQVEERIARDQDRFRFAVFGDQRALADGEWQELVAAIDRLHEAEPLDFVLDTGDIVQDGRHTDQFAHLRGILEPISELPYLVCIGNHETKNNLDPAARTHTAIFLANLDPAFSADRFYFRKDIGDWRVLFLDSNDLVYGDDGSGLGRTEPVPGTRAAAQMRWLKSQLTHAEPPDMYTAVVIHHPLIHTSEKHREQAVTLWDYGAAGRKLRDLFLAGGVDLILCGHTHTYERFLLEKDGNRMHLVNVSGRPRASFLWMGDGARRPTDVRGRESSWFRDHGWDLDGWSVTQEAVMLGEEENQFVIFEADGASPPKLTVHLLEEDSDTGTKVLESVELK